MARWGEYEIYQKFKGPSSIPQSLGVQELAKGRRGGGVRARGGKTNKQTNKFETVVVYIHYPFSKF